MIDGIERGAAALDKEIASGKKSKKKRLRVVSGDESFNAAGRRVIRLDGGKLPEILDQTEQALAEYDGNIFNNAGRLVRLCPSTEPPNRWVRRPHGALIIHQIDGPHLTELATRAAIYERYDHRSDRYKPVNCPLPVAVAFLSRGGWRLRNLAGFIEAPIITADGRVIDRQGYDAATGLYLSGEEIPGYATPPAKPTMADAESGIDALFDLFVEFPFVSNDDRAAAAAGVMTALLRRALPAAPMMAITAPTPGTGKTLIAETFAAIATGRRASVLSLGHDEAEAEKRLAGVLLAGDACIVIDNIERPMRGDLLCQVTTQQFVRLRPLGASGMLSIATHALMVATGNNLSIRGDLKRRVVLIRLDAGQERPEQRTFKRDHLDVVFAQRGALIRAALTISLAYLAAGAPDIPNLRPFGGFEHWDRMVRRPLLWLGLPDPLTASEGLRELDPDIEGMRQLLGAWAGVFGEQPTTAAEVTAKGMNGEHTNPELYDALQLVCAEKPNPRRLGYWLRTHRDRIVDGMQLKQGARDEHAKVSRWRVTKCG